MTLDINVSAALKAARLAIRQFASQKPPPDGYKGVIVNTASVAGLIGSFLVPVYCASKWGMLS